MPICMAMKAVIRWETWLELVGGLKMPNAPKLRVGNIIEIEGVPSTEKPKAAWAKWVKCR